MQVAAFRHIIDHHVACLHVSVAAAASAAHSLSKDAMFLPEAVDERLEKLQAKRDET